MVAIVWIRRTLREFDNMALVEASKEHDEVIPFYVVDEEYFQKASTGYPKLKFWHDALSNLKQDLKDKGKDLVVRSGEPIEELQKIIKETDADSIYFNRDYSKYSRKRDEKVKALDVKVKDFKDIVMFEKDEILTNSGTPYKVYTYYSKKWFNKEKRRPQKPEEYAVPDGVESDEIPSLEELGFEEPEDFEWIWNASREGAKERLEEFKENILNYDEDREYAWKDSTSKLSPHLKFGTISIREVFWEAERMKARNPENKSGIKTWQEELAWRDFYFQMLYNFPESREKALQEQFRSIEWRSKEEEASSDWKAFINGKTGYPFVDAGMRQLKQTGWMHNRLRMVVTCFACKDLWLDWKDLHDFFNENFVDAEIASMIGGIQWAYSIGTDAQPYFRVFNPWTQGEKYDPEGDYIRKWVPELENVPDEHIHRPYRMSRFAQENSDCIIGEDYPRPIVEHDKQRQKAVKRFEEARED